MQSYGGLQTSIKAVHLGYIILVKRRSSPIKKFHNSSSCFSSPISLLQMTKYKCNEKEKHYQENCEKSSCLLPSHSGLGRSHLLSHELSVSCGICHLHMNKEPCPDEWKFTWHLGTNDIDHPSHFYQTTHQNMWKIKTNYSRHQEVEFLFQ